jgi:hypothetical protein
LQVSQEHPPEWNDTDCIGARPYTKISDLVGKTKQGVNTLAYFGSISGEKERIFMAQAIDFMDVIKAWRVTELYFLRPTKKKLKFLTIKIISTSSQCYLTFFFVTNEGAN